MKPDLPDRQNPRVSLGELDVEAHLADPRLRQAYVTPMFDLIAPRYDRFTRLFSFGMDQRWKRELVEMVRRAAPLDGIVCDVACGTGDLAYAIADARKDLTIVAGDVSGEMLMAASARAQGRSPVTLTGGDLSLLPLRSAAVDVVTAGYALRNTPDWRKSLQELARVIRPGGHLFTLDFYLPESMTWRRAFLAWLHAAGRAFGWWWHREPMAYGYIAHSIRHFTTAGAFARALRDAGFDIVEVQSRLGGGIALHHAQRR